MFKVRSLHRIAALVVLSAFLLSSTWALTALGQPSGVSDPKLEIIQVDVAEDATRFVFSKEYVFPDGMPKHGSTFVTQGYIYPSGTLSGTNGATKDGEPEFPDKVIGVWYCYGAFVGEGGHATTGPWVLTTQIFQFNEKYNNATIVTNGTEIADLNVPLARAIVGGTGVFSTARGEQMQTLLGFTENMGVNLRVELRVADVQN